MPTKNAIHVPRFPRVPHMPSLHVGFLGSQFLPILAFLLLAATTAHADQSQFVSAKLETRAVSQSLQSEVARIAAESPQPTWIAYEVPAAPSNESMCCGNYRGDGQEEICRTCTLEKHQDDFTVVKGQNTTIKLEASPQLTVLLRVDQKHIMRIQIASSNCTMDAGGLRVVWLKGVKADDSVTLLTAYVIRKDHPDDGDNLAEQSLAAIAHYADPSADRVLASFVAPDQPVWLRDKTSFWLGAARGKSGLVLLEKMAKDDPSPDVRAKVSFAFFVSHEPGAVDDIIHMAKDDSNAHVRGQALFWLAQKAGQKAAATITGAIQNDPDTELKKKAVFALSQMPKDEGIPKLIQVAQSNKNPEVRKQAMFWLGQSQDPRAVAFFEKILAE
ncbi:MAG: HEAT repeat domain-containing protein [Candidatus Acidiferrum sp.]